MLSDLHLGAFQGTETVSEYEQELLLQYQLHFFAASNAKRHTTKKGKKKARRKMPKCPFAVTGQRQSALLHLKALDKQLKLTTGAGLNAYGDNGYSSYQIASAFLLGIVLAGCLTSIPRTLTLHLDEGSPAYAMVWFLTNQCDLRMMAQRDIFHREWNDTRLAVTLSHLWDVVILTTVVFNLPHGPWDGGTWHNKMKESALRIIAAMPSSNPLFVALYELICEDLGLTPSGDLDHKEAVREMMMNGDAFRVKGAKVSLRRWFSWFAAADLYLPLWHQRLMTLITIGQATGVYKVLRDVPLWSNFVDTRQAWVHKGEAPAETQADAPVVGDEKEADDSSSGSEGSEKEVRAIGAQQAQEAVAKASASNPQAPDDKAGTKENAHQTLTELRRVHGNTLLLSATVLSKLNLRLLTAILTEVCRPVFTDHSEHASECRAPQAIIDFYINAAQGAYMNTLHKVASSLLDVQKLKHIGFITDVSKGSVKGTTVTSAVVQSESGNAFHMLDLVCSLIFTRIASMLYHSHSWPGLLALLCSPEKKIFLQGLGLLIEGFKIYEIAVAKAKVNSFIAELVSTSPFKSRLVREMAIMATAPLCISDEQRFDKIREYMGFVWGGWGQTKVVEDCFRACRLREDHDTNNKTRNMISYYGAMAKNGVIGQHQRQEVTFDQDEPASKGPASGFFIRPIGFLNWRTTMQLQARPRGRLTQHNLPGSFPLTLQCLSKSTRPTLGISGTGAGMWISFSVGLLSGRGCWS